jgi:hypothetical protein
MLAGASTTSSSCIGISTGQHVYRSSPTVLHSSSAHQLTGQGGPKQGLHVKHRLATVGSPVQQLTPVCCVATAPAMHFPLQV